MAIYIILGFVGTGLFFLIVIGLFKIYKIVRWRIFLKRFRKKSEKARKETKDFFEKYYGYQPYQALLQSYSENIMDIPVLRPLTNEIPLDPDRKMTPMEMIKDNQPKITFRKVTIPNPENAKIFENIINREA